MSKLINNLKTINSAARTTMVFVVAGAVSYGGYVGYENYIKPGVQAKQAIADLEDLKNKYELQQEQLKMSEQELQRSQVALKVSEEMNERLETSMKLLKVDRRVANIKVLEKGLDELGEPYLEVSFTELSPESEPIGSPRIYIIKGEKLYIDGWIVAFDDKYVENADELRAASLYVFKGIYGDAEMPKDAQQLDFETQDRGIPGIYADGVKREFEEKIWGDFWRVCNDESLQNEMGIRASHGVSNYILAEEGKTYQVDIRSSGSMNLKPIEEP